MNDPRVEYWLSKTMSGWRGLFSRPWVSAESTEDKRHAMQPRTWKMIGVVVFLFAALPVAGTTLYLMFANPRMRIQPHYPPYQAQMPPTPAGIIPVSAPEEAPAVPAGSQLESPLPDTESTRAIGRVYYGYYCAFCHGQAGEVTGPVGRSYVPTPTPLTLLPIQAMSDDQIYRAMLTGAGHEPVLDYVIDPQACWYIVRYVRRLPQATPSGP